MPDATVFSKLDKISAIHAQVHWHTLMPVCTAPQAVDVTRIWDLLLSTAAAASTNPSGPSIVAQLDSKAASAMDTEAPSAAFPAQNGSAMDTPASQPGLAAANGDVNAATGDGAAVSGDGAAARDHAKVPTHVAVGGRSGLRMLLIPPPQARDDPLAIVDLCRAAEVQFGNNLVSFLFV